MSTSKWSSQNGGLPVLIVSVIILSALFFFNMSDAGYEKYIVVNIGCLMWLPLLYILLYERNDVTEFGLRPVAGGIKGYKAAGVLYLCALPIYIIGSQIPSFQQYYPIQKQAAIDWAFFAYFELTYGMYLFCWEFFFRGFMLFGLSRYSGWLAVIVQAIAFGAMHIGKPLPEVIVSFFAGLILGVLALRSQSFLPCFALHWMSALSFDLLIVLTKRGIIF